MVETYRILVIDDEPDIVDLISYNLGKEGFQVAAAHSGEEGLKKIKEGVLDLLILDLMLPGIKGMELCRILKNDPKTQDLPIIMVTAKGDEVDRVLGLEMGADDYIAKPFSPRELVARVRAVLRRAASKRTDTNVVRAGDLVINRVTYQVMKGDKLLTLSSTEFKLLLFLVERKGRVFSRDQLLDAVWKGETFVGPRNVDVYISRLRMQIEDNPLQPLYIKTRRGIGYYVDAAL
jgi:phosphate regulon transcriptional regulator PhoB